MKIHSLLFVVLAALTEGAPAAPVAITGAMTYVQNFNSLGTASLAWTDDSTISGWYAQINNGLTATGSSQATDGTGTVLSGLLNLGTTGAADRALGSKATGTGNLANIAYAVQFRNSSAHTVLVSRIIYTGELCRTNSGGAAEVFTVYSAVSSAAITDIQSGPNSANAAAGIGVTELGRLQTGHHLQTRRPPPLWTGTPPPIAPQSISCPVRSRSARDSI